MTIKIPETLIDINEDKFIKIGELDCGKWHYVIYFDNIYSNSYLIEKTHANFFLLLINRIKKLKEKFSVR